MLFDNELGWRHLDPTDGWILQYRYLRCRSGFSKEEFFRCQIVVFPEPNLTRIWSSILQCL